MLTRQERLNNAIAFAHANGTPVHDPSLTALGSKVVTCAECDGTGLPENAMFARVEFCKACNGRGYNAVAQPKPVRHADAFDFRKKQA